MKGKTSKKVRGEWMQGFRGGKGKESTGQCRRCKKIQVGSLGWEDPLEEEMATHFSILTWEITRTEEPGGLQSMGSQRVGHNYACTQSVQLPIQATHWGQRYHRKNSKNVADKVAPACNCPLNTCNAHHMFYPQFYLGF